MTGAAGDDLADSLRAKAEATMFLGDDQTHEAIGFQVSPGLRGQVSQVIHLRAVGHVAEGLDLLLQERFFFRGEWLYFKRGELGPIWISAEEFSVPPNTARFQGNSFGLAHSRQEGSDKGHGGAGQDPSPKLRHTGNEANENERAGADYLGRCEVPLGRGPARNHQCRCADQTQPGMASEEQAAANQGGDDEGQGHGQGKRVWGRGMDREVLT